MTEANEGVETLAPTAKQVLHYLGTSLSQNSEAVSVAVTEGEDNKVKLILTVDKGDMGRVIGRHGKIAGAIRAVVRAAAAKDGVDAQVEIAEVE